MTPAQFAARKERAEGAIWVISKTVEGFHVYSPAAPTKSYVVSGIPDTPACTCPDFQAHRGDPEWRCKHILAVLDKAPLVPSEPETDAELRAERDAIQAEAASPAQAPAPTRRPVPIGNGVSPAQMLIKRSVSPDGRIDSVSVEFAMPVNGESAKEIKARALRTLELQNQIATAFLGQNGNGNGNGAHPVVPKNGNGGSTPSSPNGQPLPARLIDIRSAEGRYGEQLFISVNANGKRLRLYGTPSQLASYIGYAGERIHPNELAPGIRLNIPCRVVLDENDNGFITVAKVLRAGLPRANGGRQWQPARS
jgi:SWIM zinc finger